MHKKIAVLTSSRAEYGILYWLLRRINSDKILKLYLVVTGAHLSKEFGNTIDEIKQDGFEIAAKIDILQAGDSRVSMAKSTGLGIVRFCEFFNRLKPDILLVLGDRFEIFAAAFAAKILNIPIVHISGGETTLGAIDNELRYSISLMSRLHFVKNNKHKEKLLNLGIDKDDIFVVGYLGLENLAYLKKLRKDNIELKIKVRLKYPFALVTFHPVTSPKEIYDNDIKNLLMVLSKFNHLYYIFTAANEDFGGRMINKEIEQFCLRFPEKGIFMKNLGRELYLNLMSKCNVVIGNSSSGILESIFFKVPVVNIEPRQLGREKSQNIISCQNTAKDLYRAINKALSQKFINKIYRGKIKNKFKVISPKSISKTVIKIIKKELF